MRTTTLRRGKRASWSAGTGIRSVIKPSASAQSASGTSAKPDFAPPPRADDASAHAAVEALVPEMASGEVRTLLAKFGLKADHVNRPVDELSPGERTRASLALLQARGVNVLVLDEPTNHLDLEAIEQLEQALETYEGALLLVTHDRRMLDTVRTDRRWQVQDGRVTER